MTSFPGRDRRVFVEKFRVCEIGLRAAADVCASSSFSSFLWHETTRCRRRFGLAALVRRDCCCCREIRNLPR